MGSLQLEATDSHTSNHKDNSVKSVTTTAPFSTIQHVPFATFFRVRTRVCPAQGLAGLRLAPASCIGLWEGLVKIIYLFVYLVVLSPLRISVCMNLFHNHGLYVWEGQHASETSGNSSRYSLFRLFAAVKVQ